MSKCVVRQHHRRNGQALIEFAVISLVTTILVAAVLSYGLLILGANVLQQAVDVGAQELARMPLPAQMAFGDSPYDTGSALHEPKVMQELFDEQHLVIDLTAGEVDDFTNKPLINRLLRPLMIYEEAVVNGASRRLIRYPGALVESTANHPLTGNKELTVLIPIIGARDPVTGVETIAEWRHVVEEIRSNGIGPFSLASSDPANLSFQPGVVAMRINYPYQSGALVAVQYKDAGGALLSTQDALTQDVVNSPIQADDSSVTNAMIPVGYGLVVTDGGSTGANAGTYGLGRQFAFTMAVRPYRKLVSSQAIYRREVYGQ